MELMLGLLVVFLQGESVSSCHSQQAPKQRGISLSSWIHCMCVTSPQNGLSELCAFHAMEFCGMFARILMESSS